MIAINMRVEGLAEVLRNLEGPAVKVGAKRGMKKVGNSVSSLASRLIREEYNLKKVDVDDNFEVKTTDDGAVLIICKSRPINLTKFGAKQFGASMGKRVTTKRSGDGVTRTTRGKAGSFGGVTVPIAKAHTTLLPGAFIAKVKSGKKGAFNIGVFTRANHAAKTEYNDQRNRRKTSRPYVMRNRSKSPRAAIINMAFVSVSTLFRGKKVTPAIEEYLQGDALKVVMHEIEWAIQNEK